MKYLTILIALLLAGCASQQTRPNRARTIMQSTGVNLTLDTFHQAAKIGAFDIYFDLMTDDSVFMGTDETERWNKQQFMNYAREPFADGHGWTYEPSDRHVAFNDDLTIAWADELLTHEKYGTLRGTSVLEKHGNEWLIAHYSLTFLVPNDIASEVVEIIKRFEENNDQ
ncbi:MAG: nuclear transport factor 2 family protein [Phycisphaerales bacterium]|nr:nuclear transport factor 2 family protein [Phycisphaerales bacterium]